MFSEVKLLIIEDRIQEAIDSLVQLISNRTLSNELILLGARFKEIEKQRRTGVTDFTVITTLTNKLRLDLLELINEAEAVKYRKPGNTNKIEDLIENINGDYEYHKDLFEYFQGVDKQIKEIIAGGNHKALKTLAREINENISTLSELKMITEEYYGYSNYVSISDNTTNSYRTISISFSGGKVYEYIDFIEVDMKLRDASAALEKVKGSERKLLKRYEQFSTIKDMLETNKSSLLFFTKLSRDIETMLNSYRNPDPNYKLINDQLNQIVQCLGGLKVDIETSQNTVKRGTIEYDIIRYCKEYMQLSSFKGNLTTEIAGFYYRIKALANTDGMTSFSSEELRGY